MGNSTKMLTRNISIIEQQSVSKYGMLDGGEDGIVVTDGFIAVIDGATSKNHSGKRSDSITSDDTPGRRARNAIMATIMRIPPETPAYSFIMQVNDAVASIMPVNDMHESENHGHIVTDKPQASIIVYSKMANQVWSFGDCTCIVNNIRHDDQKRIDIENANRRANKLYSELACGKTVDELLRNDIGRKEIRSSLLQQSQYANTDGTYGYPVLDGGDIREEDIIKYDVNENSDVILSSDGYPLLMSTLKASEEMLQETITSDPLMIDKYKQTKGVYPGQVSYDDRSYIRFHVGRGEMTNTEDSLKLTTDYNMLIKQYEKGVSLANAYGGLPRPYEYINAIDSEEYAISIENSNCLAEDGRAKFPIIVEAWHANGKPIMVDDHANKMYEPPVYLQVNTDKIMNAHKSSTLYNNIAVRIDDVKMHDGIITLSTSRTTYFASLLTNRAMDYHFNDGPTVRQMYEYDFHTPPLHESQLSNHLGVNGIVVTLDNIAVFVNRSKNVSIGKESYGTGVAGSIKARYAIDPTFGVLPSTINAAIMQEIWDEMKLDPLEYTMLDFTLEQNLIAFYRDLVEGGKPQFLIHCKLPITFDELSKRMSNHNNDTDNTALLADGTQIVGVKKKDLENAVITPDGISARTITGDVQFLPMMPSASASVAMYLK